MMVVGTGEADRYLKPVLERLKQLVDDIVIGCNATDVPTLKLIQFYTDKIYDFTEFEWGKQQWQIKELLLKEVAKLNPEWIVCQDSDEILDKRLDRQKLELLAEKDNISYIFYCVHLWNNNRTMRTDGGWGNFYNVRFYRFIPEAPMLWKRTPLHCGLAPMYAYQWSTPSGYCFEHYGYMKEEDRQKKAIRYNKYDRNGLYFSKSWYQSILGEPHLKVFDDNFLTSLQYKPRPIKIEKIIKNYKPMKTYYVRNKKGYVWSINEQLITETLKRPGMTLVSVEDHDKIKKIRDIKIIKDNQTSSVEQPVQNDTQCIICGFKAKSAFGLRSHKKSHK